MVSTNFLYPIESNTLPHTRVLLQKPLKNLTKPNIFDLKNLKNIEISRLGLKPNNLGVVSALLNNIMFRMFIATLLLHIAGECY